MYPWRFEATDLAGTSLGVLTFARDREVSIPHNGPRTAAFTLPIANEASLIRQVNALDSTLALVKAYRGNALEFHGFVTTAERVGQGEDRSLKVTCMDAWSVLAQRYLAGAGGIAAGGIYIHTQTGDSGQLALDAIGDANSAQNDFGGEAASTGIWAYEGALDPSPAPYLSGSSISIAVTWPGRTVASFIDELSASSAGFDWRIVPMERRVVLDPISGSGASRISYWHSAAVIGTQRPDCTFDQGGNKLNLANATKVTSRLQQANTVAHLNSAVPTDQLRRRRTTPSNLLGQVREDLIESDLSTAADRDALSDLHLGLRAGPKVTIAATPLPYDASQPQRVPQYRRDWDIGDWAKARAVDAAGEWFNGWTRIWGAKFNIDSEDKELVTLTLVPDAL